MRYPSSDYHGGYGTSPRPLEPDPRVVQPPRGQPSLPKYVATTNGGGAAGSSALASDMDALNLNNMNPEAVSAAWQVLYTCRNITLQHIINQYIIAGVLEHFTIEAEKFK